MGRYLSLPILLIAAIIQSTVIPLIRFRESGPDLILVLVLSWAMLAGLQEGILWAMVGGIIQDILNGTPTGTTALVLVILVFLIDLILGPVERGNLIIPPLVIVIGTLLYDLLLTLLLAVFGRGLPISYVVGTLLLPNLIFNLVFSLPLFRVMGLIHRAAQPKRVSL